MKLTTRQKVYAGIAGLGLLAVAADRLLILPHGAAADAPAPDSYAVSSAERRPAAPLPVPAPLSQRPTIADRLDAVAAARRFDLTNVRDAFVPSPAWLAGSGPQPPGLESGRLAAERFRGAHMLTAVVASGEKGYAIIDGQILFIGQVLDGFRLVAVRPRSVVLESNDTRIELVMPSK
jgi:hypothetical protein